LTLIAATTDSTHFSPTFVILIITVIISILSAFFLYSQDKHSLTYYGDSVSHLVRAREIVDSSNPGIFEQLGTNWLPLPHILLLPFTLIDLLFNTGLAGLAVSLPCFAITTVLLYRILKSQLDAGYVAILGALLYASNPNIIYLGITPMTEAPFMLFFVSAAYFFLKWMSGPKKYLSVHTLREGKILTKPTLGNSFAHRSSHLVNLLLCSVFISLATLSRYEGWILPPFLVYFVVATSLKRRHHYTSRYNAVIILISTLSFGGIVFWLAWNMYAFGDAIEFGRSPYFSATSHALEKPNRALLYLQPWNVASLYSLTAFVVYGPVLIVSSLLGYLFHRISGKTEERKRRRNLLLFLAMPPVFTLLSMVGGIGEMNPKTWLNSRFLILLAPLAILLASFFLARLHVLIRTKNQIILAGVISIFFVYQLITPALGAITFLSAAGQFFETFENKPARPFQIKAAETLASIYDGSGKILIITGSSQQNKIMQSSGIPLKQYEQILESGSQKDSFKEPWSHVKYVVLGKDPDISGTNVSNYWMDRQSLLQRYFTTKYEDKYYMIMESSKSLGPNEELAAGTTRRVASIPEAENNLLLHNHIHLNASIDDKPIVIPANIGIDPKFHKNHTLDVYGPQKSPIHTHTTSGTIHVESKIITNYTLGDFLDVWGIPLEGKTVKTTIDGKRVSDFRSHVLENGEKIGLVICSRMSSTYLDRC
jgi:hypothetical protein